MKKKSSIFIIGLSLLIGFVFFSRWVKHGALTNIDFNTTVRLQDKIPVRFDELMADGAIFADPFVSSGLVLLVTGIMFLRLRGKRKVLAFLIPFAFAALTLIEMYGKNFVPHPGPPFFMVKHPTTIFPEFTIIQPYSYPSGHMARITFLALIYVSLITYHLSQKRKKVLLLIVSLITGYVLFIGISRIYLGHHWLSDIIGGGLLGASSALLGVVLTVGY